MRAGGVHESFGEQLRRHRERASLTQEELAARAGLTAMAVSALERGDRRRPYPNTVRALADALALVGPDRAEFVAAVPRRADAPTLVEVADLGAEATAGLPPQPTPLLGRDEEFAVVRDQLLAPEVRLLTLVGAGGVGKTRLAMAVAGALAGHAAFADGACFVDLSAVREPSLVCPTVARALRAPDAAGRAVIDALKECVRHRRQLLVLDNFEQVLPAAADLAPLLAVSPGLTVLVTSREPLRLRWERTLPLPPLAVPDPKHLLPLDRLALVPAVALFLERARAAAPGFGLTPENARAVAELCVRLDGLPLAIELVAPRAAQLGAAAALDRLGRRLPLPASPMQDAPARQHSLRATLQWSVDLLGPAEQALFRRVAAFAGGWTLEAAEAVAGPAMPEIGAMGVGVPDVLGGLTSLADKNLVLVQPAGSSPRAASAEPRFRMLETAREFALDLLEASGEAGVVRRRHAEFFATFAEQSEPRLQGAGQAAMVARLEHEEDNFRQALRWTFERGDAQAQEQGLRLAGALGWYWFLHGAPSEAREWFQVLLRPMAGADRPSAVRARALNAAGFRATNHAEYGIASEFHDRALSIWRALRDTPGMVASLHGLGDTALWVGAAAKARAHYEEGLELARTTGTAEDLALFAFHLGQLWWLEGDLDLGEEYGQEALAVARAAGSTTWTAYALYVLASLAHERGDLRRAGGLYREALALGWEHHDRLCVRMALPGLAGVAAMEGDAARALRLAGAASALEENAGMWAFPPIRARQERWLATAEQALDAASREAARAEGRRMTMDEVIAHALEDTRAVAGATSEAAPAVRDRLSPREREVLGLVAQGRSNREIAEALVVTEHTAKYHVAQLLNKLGAGSRAEAVARAVAAGLLAPTPD
jgi:predicted ATPase/DNA-binding CsgD family transcriptional regulator/DNA-binding XRE family transcriptional regulator